MLVFLMDCFQGVWDGMGVSDPGVGVSTIQKMNENTRNNNLCIKRILKHENGVSFPLKEMMDTMSVYETDQQPISSA